MYINFVSFYFYTLESFLAFPRRVYKYFVLIQFCQPSEKVGCNYYSSCEKRNKRKLHPTLVPVLPLKENEIAVTLFMK